MHVGDRYKVREYMMWSKREFFVLSLMAAVPTILYVYLDWIWLGLPWQPVATIGSAAAFLLAFRNNSTYDRVWEARMIWGSIVNLSRTWAIQVKDLLSTDDSENIEFKKTLINRHIGWLTILRFQLRKSRPWETMLKANYREYLKFYKVPEWEESLASEIKPFLHEKEWADIQRTRNPAIQIFALQSQDLRLAYEHGWLDSYRFTTLMGTLGRLIEEQGKCERIKDFPYPRQFATVNFIFIRVFIFLIPYGLMNELGEGGSALVWLTIPVSLITSLAFYSLEKIGAHTESPFQGASDDIPITSIARNIEIDIKEMFHDKKVPSTLEATNNILM
jgi:putative membrane protein